MSIDMEVYVPCPISTCGIVNVTDPSLPIRMNALGSKLAGAASTLALSNAGKPKPRTNPPETTPALRNARRDTPVAASSSGLTATASSSSRVISSTLLGARRRQFRGVLDGFSNPQVGPTTADVPGHRIVDGRVVWMRVARQQSRRGHDLAGLAVAALHHLQIQPCPLDLAAGDRVADCFDRRDRPAAHAFDGRHARAGRGSVQMDRAGTA